MLYIILILVICVSMITVLHAVGVFIWRCYGEMAACFTCYFALFLALLKPLLGYVCEDGCNGNVTAITETDSN